MAAINLSGVPSEAFVTSHPLLRSTFSSSYFEVVSVCFVVLSPSFVI